ncbi:hypothetical protein ACVNAN_001732 [Enterobacter hormaechei]|uniref:tail fiber/spike domain-containing protein n=2 Tax=Enterobacter TaxID=547 RepID=UPI000445F194|nr:MULTISPECIES: hypothetical protein [Enterobacter cloacae complex]AIE64497.1 hypothetical protein ECNIH2_14220 [Enterobacter cloacae ECNIH2]EJV1261945.1 hypothetical protein [Enterobacter hormaechei]EKS6579506.1 hypothetical protein [Enterobacter hormaechei]EKU3240513.1 hypothetical protein [Enterobacter hormaechei]EKV8336149.1 hypothetical protein [Enterobacter hormaechei]
MATTPTNLSVPSESPRDLKFNAGKIDEFVTSLALQYIDRFGDAHYTIEGLKALVLQQIYNLGWNPVGSFQGGATVSSAGDIIQDETNGVWYRWDDLSSLPKAVPAGSTPGSTGGIGEGKWLAVDVNDVLRKDLQGSNGSTLIGGSVYVVDYFSDAKVANAGKSKYIMTRGHHALGVGAGTYIRNGTTGVPSSGTEYKFFDSTGSGWTLTGMSYDCQQFGVNGDGTNETAKVQLWLDSCADYHARAYIKESFSASVVGVVLNSSHKGLQFDFRGWLKFFGDGSAPVNAPSNVTGSACFAVYMNGCTSLSGQINIDGNRSAKIYSEQIHNIGMFGGVDNNLTLNFIESRGDGVYVNHHKANVSTPPAVDSVAANNFPTRLKLRINSVNSSFDGRNAVSLIAYKGCEVSGMSSQHGNGTPSGSTGIGKQPGGLDVEPNYYWQSCYDLVVPSWISDGAGWTGGFSLVGKINGTDSFDVNIRGVIANIECTQSIPNDSVRYGVALQYARDIDIRGVSRCLTNNPYSTFKSCGVMATCISNFNVEIDIVRFERVGEIACEDVINQAVTMCSNGKLSIKATNCHNGLSLSALDNVNVDLFFTVPVTMSGSGDRGVVQYIQSYFNGAFQATNIQHHTLKVSASGGTTLTSLNYGVRVHPTNTPTVFRDTCTINESDLTAVPHDTSNNKNRLLGTVNFQKGIIYGATKKVGDDAISGTNIWGAGDTIWHQSSSATHAGKRYNGTSWQNFGNLV